VKKYYSGGIAPKSHAIKLSIGDIRIGLGFGDFSGSVPRFAYFGPIIKLGRKWNCMFRIWNIALQIYKMEPPK
jgi:hypothetical protein